MKEYSVFLTPDAKQDINEIYDYIAFEKGAPESAIAYIRKLRDKCYKLEYTPIRGRNRSDIREGLRVLALDKNAVAAFDVNEKQQTVRILGVFYGGQNYDAIMRDD